MRALVIIFWMFIVSPLLSQDWSIKVSFDGLIKDDLKTGYSVTYEESIARNFSLSIGAGDNEAYNINVLTGLKFFLSEKQRGFYLLHQNGFIDGKLSVIPCLGFRQSFLFIFALDLNAGYGSINGVGVGMASVGLFIKNIF